MKNTSWIALAIVFLVVLFASSERWNSGLVDQYADSTHVAQRGGINLIGGSNVTVSSADDATNNRVNFTFASTATTTLVTAGSDGDSTTVESDSGLEYISDELTALRGCADNQILKWDETEDDWNCEADATGAGGSAIVLDLGDDDSNESTDLNEIATTGDTNSIFTSPSADKLLIGVASAWPAADALAANPADCAANNFATTIAASGDLTCAQVNFTDLAGTATDAQVPDSITISLAATATALAADPTDCGASTFATTIAASGNLTCASVDISDDTNLVAGTNITLSVDTLNVDDAFLLLAGDTSTGAYDFSGSSGFAIPHGTSPTINTSGEIAVDSTNDQLVYYDGTSEQVLDPLRTAAMIVENPTSSEDLSFFHTERAITIQIMRAVLVGSATPSVTWTVRHSTDRNAAGNEVVTSGTTTTSTTTGSDITSFNDATIPADSWIWIETTAQSGTVNSINVTVHFTTDRT